MEGDISIDIPVAWSMLEEQARTRLHAELLKTEAFQFNKFGEFNYGGLNNEKSLNTTLYPNANAPAVCRENSTFFFSSPFTDLPKRQHCI